MSNKAAFSFLCPFSCCQLCNHSLKHCWAIHFGKKSQHQRKVWFRSQCFWSWSFRFFCENPEFPWTSTQKCRLQRFCSPYFCSPCTFGQEKMKKLNGSSGILVLFSPPKESFTFSGAGPTNDCSFLRPYPSPPGQWEKRRNPYQRLDNGTGMQVFLSLLRFLQVCCTPCTPLICSVPQMCNILNGCAKFRIIIRIIIWIYFP